MPTKTLKTIKEKLVLLFTLLFTLLFIPLFIPLLIGLVGLFGLPAPASALDRYLDHLPDAALDREIVIREWLVTGPFLAAPGDGNIDFLGGLHNGGERSIIPLPAQSFPCPLAEGGSVGWTKLSFDGSDVKIFYNGIRWESSEAPLGKAATLAVGYAWARFNSAGRVRALVLTGGVSVFYLNGVAYEGEAAYGDINTIPVILKAGENTVMLKFAGRKRAAFTFKFAPPASDLIITDDYTLPDVLENSPDIDAPAAFTLVNTTARWMRDVVVRAAAGATASGGGVSTSKEFSIAPLSALKIPLKISIPAAPAKSPDESQAASKEIPLRIEALSGGAVVSFKDVAQAVKSVGDVVRHTFISGVDGSVQYYALRYPTGYFLKGRRYALIAALHGAGVEAGWMAAAYGAKDFAFVLAPVNRRPYGFDWQDFGRLDFYEALADVKSRFDIDARRIYLSGASMGGAGVWHIGLHDPSAFAALSPLAGWTSYYLYAPLFMQRSILYAPPELLSFRQRALADSDSLRFTQNALNLPVVITHGAQDDSVPPLYARLMNAALSGAAAGAGADTEIKADAGAHVLYRELPGRGHWWDEPRSEGGGADCVDSPEIMEYLRSKTLDEYPKTVTFSLYDLSINDRFYWIRVLEQGRPFSHTHVSARVSSGGSAAASSSGSVAASNGGSANNAGVAPPVSSSGSAAASNGGVITVDSENVVALQLNLAEELVGADTARVVWNGKTRTVSLRGQRKITLRISAEGSASGETAASGGLSLKKTAGLYGPLRAAFYKPFVIVYGTGGNAQETQALMHNARLLSMRFLRRANGFAPVLPDTRVSKDIVIKNYNLVLLGSPERNLITRKIMGRLPIRVGADGVTVGRRRLTGELSAALVYPNPLNPARLVAVFAGTTPAAEDFSLFFNPVSSGAGLPDFIVFDARAKTLSWGGVRAAGFFSSSWGLENNDYYIGNIGNIGNP